MSEKLITLVKRLSDATKVSEQDIISNVEISLGLNIVTEEEIEKIIYKISTDES
ncbi:hypothetical protein [Clostridium sp. JS66]|uniref:hypothetical protein n=1 Tax=Clostridium sp. JS66 TaxID=3064705 RepID=UPI00298D661B|nr:hypothetical protein [Clostridium sp. JS66]WPC44054.1 hypothetical protein Q6H37_11430 [Clostridium sp. JS66]